MYTISAYCPIFLRFALVVALTFTINLTHLFATNDKVGLVLSGGGAKGLTHIGVIKALEENNIPIDYVAGTSMGAIVASFYAMGYTVDEMITVIKSDDFMRWQTGNLDKTERYYFLSKEATPSIIELKAHISKGDSIQIQANILPTNIANPRQMNLAFMALFDPYTAACNEDFDALMVPFRCVASDIYKKKAVVFSDGNLALAVRASMSFPFMYRPVVTSDGSVLYDGGIYNNFPVNVMESDFKPNYTIGVSVSDNPQKPNPRDIVEILENMIVQPTDYSIKQGLLLEFKWNNINMWDFSLVDELVRQGYDSTMAHIDEIKANVKRRITSEQMSAKRQDFKAKVPSIQFDNIIVEGVSIPQQLFIEQSVRNNKDIIDLNEFRKAYFALLSDEAIREIIPTATYNPVSRYYTLHLEVIPQDNLKVSIGGNLSSSTPNQSFIGINYQGFKEFSQKAWLNIHFGRIYNGLNLGSRLDINNSLYLKPQIVLHQYDYFDDNRWFFQPDKMSFFTQREIYAKFSVGLPVTLRSRLELGMGYGFLSDRYIQDKQLAFEYQEYDKSNHSLFSFFAKIEANSLNDIMYPTSGSQWSATTQLVGGWENFKSPSFPATSVSGVGDFWFQTRGQYEAYFKMHKYFTLGLQGEAFASWRNLLQNYTATMVQLPQFSPTPHSKVIFNEAFTASHYVAFGIKPIYTPKRNFQVRSEFYAFLPYKSIYRRADNTAYYGTPLSTIYVMTELSAVYNMKLASAGVFVNYYSTPHNNWNIGFNIGILLFKEKFLE